MPPDPTTHEPPPDPVTNRPTATDPPATGPQFDPTNPADLEELAAHLQQRSGRVYTIPAPFDVPSVAGDPTSEWRTYPEDPAIRHYDRATRTLIDVSFPAGDSFRVFGWVWEGDPLACRVIDRSGRFYLAGPAALAWVLARLIDRELTGDPPRGCPGPPPGERK